MTKEKYVLVGMATHDRRGNMSIRVFTMFADATSLDEAHGMAMRMTKRRWPESKGWGNYATDAVPCSASSSTVEQVQEDVL